jgi:hypothetical protein
LVLSTSPTISSATLSGTTTAGTISLNSLTTANLTVTGGTLTTSAVLTSDAYGNAYWKKPIVVIGTLISSAVSITTTLGTEFDRVLMKSFTYTPTSTGSFTIDIELSGEGQNIYLNSQTIPLLYQLSISTTLSTNFQYDGNILGKVAGTIQPYTSQTGSYRQVLPSLYATKTFSSNPGSITFYIYATSSNFSNGNKYIYTHWDNYSYKIKEY